VAQWLLTVFRVDIHADDEQAFRAACMNGHLAIAQWLWDLSNATIDIHAYDDNAFRMACEYGFVDVAQWLWQLDRPDVYLTSCFVAACTNGQLHVAQWLWGMCRHYLDAQFIREAFERACVRGHLHVARWLWDVGMFSIEALPFVLTCGQGELHVAQWLWDLNVDVTLLVDASEWRSACQKACRGGHLGLVQWLAQVQPPASEFPAVEGLEYACSLGHQHVVEWLWTSCDFSAHRAALSNIFVNTYLGARESHVATVTWLRSACVVDVPLDRRREVFLVACAHGRVDDAKDFVTVTDIDDGFAFCEACRCGHLNVAEWLWDVGKGFTLGVQRQGFALACKCGHLHVAQWLWDLCAPDVCGPTLLLACSHGHEDVALWLCRFVTNAAVALVVREVFLKACGRGWLVLVKWLWGAHGALCKPFLQDALAEACSDEHLDVAAWLVARGCTLPDSDSFFKRPLSWESRRWLLHKNSAYSVPAWALHHMKTWSACRKVWIQAVVATKPLPSHKLIG